MKIEQIDGYCDLFEQRLKTGERLAADDFLAAENLPRDGELLRELQRLEQEYAGGNGEAHARINELTASLPAEAIGESLGPYRLLQKIGEGGMGIVYMADQTAPVKRRVALKIIKPGMDSRQVIARFEAERQALAMMDHPNIARVLNAGTTPSGRPYFVMELVKGIPITNYCDDNMLTLKERLELFVPICQAVQHAHQKGVIHRDIKPSNILVAQYDDRAVPKVIDFGLAKALSQQLTEKTMFTQYGQVVGTIDYMSPEQALFNQLDVDTRTDIYSLGVLLYELLSGTTPFDKQRLRAAAFHEVLRIIQQEEPPRPSARLSSTGRRPAIAASRRTDPKKLSLLVRGELDWIVMKAIEKDRSRRYETANALAEDLRRYLEDEPVQACPPSAGYRFRKFARRNRAVLASAGAVAAALVLGLVGTSWALFQAIEARNQAEAQKHVAERTHGISMLSVNTHLNQTQWLEDYEDLVTESWNGLTVQIARDRRLDNPDGQPLRQELLAKSLDFWNRVVALEKDPRGRPGLRRGFYALQRAVCLSRAGHHQRAMEEIRTLADDPRREDEWAYDLIRVCALCAAGTNDEELADVYVNEGLRFLRDAARKATIRPVPADDPDLAALRSREGFRRILQEWHQQWREHRRDD